MCYLCQVSPKDFVLAAYRWGPELPEEELLPPPARWFHLRQTHKQCQHMCLVSETINETLSGSLTCQPHWPPWVDLHPCRTTYSKTQICKWFWHIVCLHVRFLCRNWPQFDAINVSVYFTKILKEKDQILPDELGLISCATAYCTDHLVVLGFILWSVPWDGSPLL